EQRRRLLERRHHPLVLGVVAVVERLGDDLGRAQLLEHLLVAGQRSLRLPGGCAAHEDARLLAAGRAHEVLQDLAFRLAPLGAPDQEQMTAPRLFALRHLRLLPARWPRPARACAPDWNALCHEGFMQLPETRT